MSGAPAIVALTAGGRALAGKLRDALPGSTIHGLRRRVSDADAPFDDTMAHLAELFAAGTPIVGICAAGILIRALAPLLVDKRSEPPVIALAEDGSAVVPLLGGHAGGNELARRIADTLGIDAALTTAGDAVFGLALDDPPPGWTVANPPVAKAVMAARLAGEPVRLAVSAGDAGWLTPGAPGWAERADYSILVTDNAKPGDATTLVLHPPTLALGIGCERDTDPAELTALIDATLAEAGLAAASVALVVSLDLKMDEPAVHAVTAHLGVPARFFDAATLEAETPRLLNPSDYVFRTVGCHGVAEGAALAAAGANGSLVVAKTRSPRATCAIARAPDLNPASIGRPQGQLTILGTGPGDAAFRLWTLYRPARQRRRPSPASRFRPGRGGSALSSRARPGGRGTPRRAGVERRSGHLRYGRAGIRTSRQRRRHTLGPHRRHGDPRSFGNAARRRPCRRPTRP